MSRNLPKIRINPLGINFKKKKDRLPCLRYVGSIMSTPPNIGVVTRRVILLLLNISLCEKIEIVNTYYIIFVNYWILEVHSTKLILTPKNIVKNFLVMLIIRLDFLIFLRIIIHEKSIVLALLDLLIDR